MAKAVVPTEFPELPEGMNSWARSTRRTGGMFHAHVLGFTACNSLRLGRHHSKPATGLADMEYWGVCPRCYAKRAAQ